MEGISSEAASIAGHFKLANLCWIYDNNKITIEGSTALTYSDDVATRFIGYGWNVTRVTDANDLDMLERAFTTFKNTGDRPTLIIVDTHIAYGAPNKQDTSVAHGEPLGEEEIRLTKRRYRWPEDTKFLVPTGVHEHFQAGIGTRGRVLHTSWWAGFEDYRRRHAELAERGYRMMRRPGEECAMAYRRLGGSRAIMQNTSDVRHRRRFQRREPFRAQHSLRHPGACDGFHT